jgi:phospholipase C
MAISRRDAIKAMGTLAGAAATSKLTGCDDESVGEITTMVFLMMENRSYDHYLGSRAFDGKPGDGLVAGMANLDRSGTSVPIWPALQTFEAMCVADPPHGWDASRVQLGDGACDGFVVAFQDAHDLDTAIEPMQYMLREHIPVTHALADAYTTCDRWFCSLLGPTLPNRMYWHAATSNGAKSNDEVLGGAFEGVTTLYHQLDAAGIDWAYYYGDIPVLGVLDDLELQGRLRRFIWDFIDDCAAGRLPPVVYVDPGFAYNDDHPPHHPLLGQMFLSAFYQAVSTSPQWPNMLVTVAYDENGGFFDHVAPPTAPDERAAEGFDQLGFRVPSMVIGPYAKPGYVSSVQYDHTSALRHVSNTFGLEPLTMRQAAANDLTDCIDLERLELNAPSSPIELPAVELDESSLPEYCMSGGDITRTVGGFDHDILAWAARDPRLGRFNDPGRAREDVYNLGEYLDRHGRGRIRRR